MQQLHDGARPLGSAELGKPGQRVGRRCKCLVTFLRRRLRFQRHATLHKPGLAGLGLARQRGPLAVDKKLAAATPGVGASRRQIKYCWLPGVCGAALLQANAARQRDCARRHCLIADRCFSCARIGRREGQRRRHLVGAWPDQDPNRARRHVAGGSLLTHPGQRLRANQGGHRSVCCVGIWRSLAATPFVVALHRNVNSNLGGRCQGRRSGSGCTEKNANSQQKSSHHGP